MILVDSSVWIDYFNGKVTPRTNWLDFALTNKPIIMGDLILTEVLQGFKSEGDFKIAKKLLLNFPVAEMVGQEVAIQSAQNYRYLRARGLTIRKTIDIIIGTFCIYHGIYLLHEDRDFDPLSNYFDLKTLESTEF
jgi:predicted nucleic acid-binding protein